jgi:hypothetical protein
MHKIKATGLSSAFIVHVDGTKEPLGSRLQKTTMFRFEPAEVLPEEPIYTFISEPLSWTWTLSADQLFKFPQLAQAGYLLVLSLPRRQEWAGLSNSTVHRIRRSWARRVYKLLRDHGIPATQYHIYVEFEAVVNLGAGE